MPPLLLPLVLPKLTPDTKAGKFTSLQRINVIRETNGSLDSCHPCGGWKPAVYMSYMCRYMGQLSFFYVKFIRSKLSNCCTHVSGVTGTVWCTADRWPPAGRRATEHGLRAATVACCLTHNHCGSGGQCVCVMAWWCTSRYLKVSSIRQCITQHLQTQILTSQVAINQTNEHTRSKQTDFKGDCLPFKIF